LKRIEPSLFSYRPVVRGKSSLRCGLSATAGAIVEAPGTSGGH
jgi:hypothetical protein